MGEYKQSRALLSFLLVLFLLAFCLPVCAFAETSECSDGDQKEISLSTIVPPNVIAGMDAVYHKGDVAGMTFATDDTTDNLQRVLIDGKTVSPANYTVSGEPLAITLHPGFLDTLPAGEHAVEIVTANGNASARFTVKAGPGNGPETVPESPPTGDERNVAFWLALMAISASAFVTVLLVSGRRRKQQT